MIAAGTLTLAAEMLEALAPLNAPARGVARELRAAVDGWPMVAAQDLTGPAACGHDASRRGPAGAPLTPEVPPMTHLAVSLALEAARTVSETHPAENIAQDNAHAVEALAQLYAETERAREMAHAAARGFMAQVSTDDALTIASVRHELEVAGIEFEPGESLGGAVAFLAASRDGAREALGAMQDVGVAPEEHDAVIGERDDLAAAAETSRVALGDVLRTAEVLADGEAVDAYVLLSAAVRLYTVAGVSA